jgi:hypothetical protein
MLPQTSRLSFDSSGDDGRVVEPLRLAEGSCVTLPWMFEPEKTIWL